VRRFGIALIALLVPLAALAKWQVFSVPGVGQAAWISDAGDYAISTTAGAYRLQADGGISERIELGASIAMIDAFVDARGCLVALPKRPETYLVYADAGCGPTTLAALGLVSADKPIRMRRAHGGGAYLSATDSTAVSSFFFYSSDGVLANFAPVPSAASPAKPSNALGALRAGGVDFGLAGVSAPNTPLARLLDGGTPSFQAFPTSESAPLELAPVDGARALLTTSAGELVRVADLGAAQASWNVLPLSSPVRAIAFAPDTDVGGIGLGMAGSTAAGPVAFQFAVPLEGAPGASWLPNTLVPPYAGVVQAADCTQDGICVAVTNAPDAGNVIVYTNEAKPTWSPSSMIVADAGVALGITVAPEDLDGDPLVVSWSAAPPLGVQTLQPDGTSIRVDVPAAPCTQPFEDYALQGSLTDGLAAHRDTREITIRVPDISPLSGATAQLDAGYDPVDAQVTGAVSASSVSCGTERGLNAQVDLTVDGVGQGGQHVSALPGGFAFPRTDCLPHTYAVTATILDGDGGVGPAATEVVKLPGQDPAVDGLAGGPLVARCGEGARGTLTARVPTNACAAQTLTWAQQGGPALVQTTGAGGSISISTQALGLQELIGEQVSVRLIATSGSDTATALATVPITADPFIDAQTELESPNPRTDSPLGVRVTVENPTACPITDAQLVEQVQDGQLVLGSARIDGRPANATLADGQVVVHGLDLAPGERHQVTFDVRPRVLGPPAPSAQVLFRGVPISQNTSLASASDSVGCSCRSASGGSETLLYVVLVGFLPIDRKRHATLRDSVRKPLR